MGGGSTEPLPHTIATSFASAVSKSQIYLFAATNSIVINEPSLHSPHLIHICPDIAEKPAPRSTTPDLENKPEKDPLAGSWSPGELAAQLDGYDLVYNLYALGKEHALIVSPNFKPQASDLRPQDLFVAYHLTQLYLQDGQQLLCFFNGGPLSGASQPHLHIQFIPFQRIPPAPDALARSLPHQTTPGILPLPYLHLFCSLPTLPPLTTSTPSSADKALISSALFDIYSSLLALSKSLLSELPESELSPKTAKRRSYNFLLTSTHMHLIPRTERMSFIPRKESLGQRDGADSLLMSINGLCFAGYWHVGTKEEAKDTEDYGLSRILVESGFRTELWDKLP